MIGLYGHSGGSTALALATVTVAALLRLAAPVQAAPIVVMQAPPVYNTVQGFVALYQDKIINQSGVTLDSGVDRSYAGLAQAMWDLGGTGGVKYNQMRYAGNFAAFLAGIGFGYAIALGDNLVDNGWTATANADLSEVALTSAGRNRDIWSFSLPRMTTCVGFDIAALDADGDGWSAADPLDWKVVISQQVVPQGFVGYQGINSFYAPTYAYTLARPDLPGDANADSYVDVADLLYLVDAFGSVAGEVNYDPACDFNGDDSVDVVDLLTMVEYWGV